MAGKGSSGVGVGRVTRRNLLGLPRHQLIAQEKQQQLQQQRQQYQHQHQHQHQQQRRLTRSPSPLPLPLPPPPPPPPDTADSLNVFVNYDGRWDDEGCYVDFKMTGILVSMNTTYHGLLELLFKELKMKPSEHTITVQYQVIKGSPPITIVSDSGVLFYLELKKKDPVLTGFPLCIVVENKPMATMIERLVEKNNHPLPINYVQTSEQLNETIYRDEQDQSNHLNMLPSATNSDNWQVQSGQDREDGYGELQPYKKRQRRYAIKFKSCAREIIPAFIAAARSYGKEDFEYYMKQLDNVDVGIRAYLAEAGNEKWSRAFFSAGRYSMMTANIAESLNIDDAKTREMPVATLVEWLTRWLHKWFTEKRSEAESTVTVLAAATEKVLRDNQVASLPLSVCLLTYIFLLGKPGENTSVCVADAGKSGKSGENTSVCVADAGKSGENTSVCLADAGKPGDNTSICMADAGKSGDNTSVCIANEGKSGDNTSICIADEGKSGDNTSFSSFRVAAALRADSKEDRGGDISEHRIRI
ncbi:hypothetical protein PanWU01x14_130050 [Parasponia andersonii]|uniref:Uncharacterized protein n=1 Tax=Parasponia andersonii TaxID=3476 RepID=A0A2P5CRL2_PARAD|nr:hypothetical protein PanWU01x14_130050 [Parasponia andersonii]